MLTLAIQKRSVQLRQLSTIHETIRHCSAHCLLVDIDQATVDLELSAPEQSREILVYLNIGKAWHEDFQKSKFAIEDMSEVPVPFYKVITILARHYLATG